MQTPLADETGALAQSRAPAVARKWSPAQVAATVCVIGLVLTGLATWAAARADHNSEARLLAIQTRQAADVLSTAVLLLEQPMATALTVQAALGPEGNPAAFERYMSATAGPGKTYASATLWPANAQTPLATVGDPPAGSNADLQQFLAHARSSSTLVVRPMNSGGTPRLAWALADPSSGLAVYVERPIASDRRAAIDSDSAYADLDYAMYLGKATTGNLAFTDVNLSSLPIDGLTYKTTIPFGDTVLTLVTSPRSHLGAPLGQRLPLMLLIGGLLLTAAAVLVAHRLVRDRRQAENNTQTITTLYERVDGLYEAQRALFGRLQRALLPHSVPLMSEFQIATEYVAGSQGVDIGGDWFSVIETDTGGFAFVVGDVSGRGVDAVAVMAQVRFTLRAYLADGQSPSSALEKCSRQFDINADGHMTTAIVGVGDRRTGAITVANAGHPLPLLLANGETGYVAMAVGPPVGIGSSAYAATTFTLPVGASLICFTDGLIERRTENIDTGMRRLEDTAIPLAKQPLGSLLTSVLDSMRDESTADDIAMLAIRRVSA